MEKKSSLAAVEDDTETFSLDTLDALGMYFKLKYSILVKSILVLDPCYMNTFLKYGYSCYGRKFR